MVLIHLKEPKHTLEINIDHAKEILVLRPDIILFELPKVKERGWIFNKFAPKDKPKKEIERVKQSFKEGAKKDNCPWLIGDIRIVESIEKLWLEGKQVLLFDIDGPLKLTKICDNLYKTKNRNQFACDMWNYLREQYMVKAVKEIQNEFPKAKIVVLCHDWHWKNIRFLLKNPSKKEIKSHYFSNIDEYVKSNLDEYKILQKYWNKFKI